MKKKNKKQKVNQLFQTLGEDSFRTTEEATDEDFFDDCPICQAMKKAKEQGRELSFEETITAFEEAKKQGGFGGGD